MPTLHKLADAGIAAVVLPSLFEEQIEREEVEIARVYEQGTETFAEATSYLPEMQDYHTGPQTYLDLVQEAKAELSIPVIGSLNGTTKGGWLEYARMIEGSGADALELNIYFLATDPNRTSAEVEEQYLELVSAVKDAVSIPVAVKIGPAFSSMANMAKRLFEVGADGLVLFNRFYQPDVNLDTLEVEPHLVLSTSDEARLPLRWIAILRSFLDGSLAATSGVHTGGDVLKLLLAGADVTMLTSALLKFGPGHVRQLLDGLTIWMTEKEYDLGRTAQGQPEPEEQPRPSRLRAGQLHQDHHVVLDRPAGLTPDS